MIYKSLKNAVAFFLKSLLAVGGLIVVAVVTLAVRLHYGPLPLDSLKPSLEKNLREIAPDFLIQLYHPALSWAGLGHPLKIHFEKVNIGRPNDQRLKAIIHKLQLTYSFLGLLTEGFHPEGIELDSPEIVFEREKILSSLNDSPENVNRDLLHFLIYKFISSNSQPSKLKLLKIHHARVTLNDEAGKEIWNLPQINVELKKTKNKTYFKADAAWQGQEYVMSFDYTAKIAEIHLSLAIPRFSTAFLNTFLKDLPLSRFEGLPFYVKKALEASQQNPLDFSLFLEASYQAGKGIPEANLQATLFEGTLTLPDVLPKSLKFHKGSIKATVKDNHIALQEGSLQPENIGGAHLKGTGLWDPKANALSFDLDAQANQIPIEELHNIWPHALAPIPRAWVLKNITKAVFSRATCALKGQAHFETLAPTFQIQEIRGLLEFKNGALDYVDGMPKIENMKGSALYDDKVFKIQVDQGQSHGLTLKKGVINIHGFDQKDQTLNMILTISAPLPAALKFIDLPPLNYARKYKLDKLKCDGMTDTTLKMDFPLSTTLTLAQVNVKTTSHLSQIRVIKPFAELDVSLSKGTMDLTVDENQIALEGQTLLNEALAQIKWEHFHSTQAPQAMRATVSMPLTLQWLKKVGFDAIPYFEGSLPTQFQYSEDKFKIGAIEINSDLAPAKLMLLGWVKPLQTPGSIKAMMTVQNGKLHALKKFSAVSEKDLKVEAEGLFDAQGKTLQSLKVGQFTIGPNLLTGTLRKEKSSGYHIFIKGKSLNIEPFLKEAEVSDFSFPKESVRLEANIDHIYFNSQDKVFQNTLSFLHQNDKFQSLEYKSYLKANHRPQDLLHGCIQSLPGQRRRLTFQTPAAGQLMKALGLPIQMSKGLLQLYAMHNDALPQGPWQGKMRILDFSVKNVPVLGQILSYAFPIGMVDLFSNKGLSFQQFRTTFVLTRKKIILSKGRAEGVSLGITLHGTIDRSMEHINLSGSVIPANVLNSFIGKLPFIGELIVGGKHEGIFSVSYTIQGSRAKSVVSVNPISLFMPGFLRKIFDLGSETPDADEDEAPF